MPTGFTGFPRITGCNLQQPILGDYNDDAEYSVMGFSDVPTIPELTQRRASQLFDGSWAEEVLA